MKRLIRRLSDYVGGPEVLAILSLALLCIAQVIIWYLPVGPSTKDNLLLLMPILSFLSSFLSMRYG